MKKPQYRRNNPKHRAVGAAPGGVDITQVAVAAAYVVSVNHKDHLSFAGNPPRPRPDASICPRLLAGKQPQIQLWLSDAIERGHFGGLWEHGFPRYVWHRDLGVIRIEARHIGQGRYKGYPLESDEIVRGLP